MKWEISEQPRGLYYDQQSRPTIIMPFDSRKFSVVNGTIQEFPGEQM